MRGEQVIVVEAVLHQQLPVGTDVVLLRAVDDLHAAGRRLLEHEVDVFARRPQVFRQRHGIGVEIQEHEAAVGLDARRLHQPELRAIEARRVGALPGHGIEPAVAVVGPAVIEAGVARRVTARLAAHHRAAMAAAVEEDAELVLAVAAEDERPAAHGAGAEVAGGAHLGFMAHVQPAALEDALLLGGEDRRLDERRASTSRDALMLP